MTTCMDASHLSELPAHVSFTLLILIMRLPKGVQLRLYRLQLRSEGSDLMSQLALLLVGLHPLLSLLLEVLPQHIQLVINLLVGELQVVGELPLSADHGLDL